MPSLKTLLPAILALAATTMANSCPKDWFENTFKGDTKCCYGNMMVVDRDAYCCVYDMTVDAEETAAPSKTADDWSTAGSCFSKIPFTASDYSSQVSVASAKVTATTTGPSTNEGTPASTNAGSASSTSSGAGPTSTNAAMPVVTAEGIVIGGAAVAVVLLAQ